MKVTITYVLDSCKDCPYKEYYHEQGFSGDFCSHPDHKGFIKCDNNRFPYNCPFLKQKFSKQKEN